MQNDSAAALQAKREKLSPALQLHDPLALQLTDKLFRRWPRDDLRIVHRNIGYPQPHDLRREDLFYRFDLRQLRHFTHPFRVSKNISDSQSVPAVIFT